MDISLMLLIVMVFPKKGVSKIQDHVFVSNYIEQGVLYVNCTVCSLKYAVTLYSPSQFDESEFFATCFKSSFQTKGPRTCSDGKHKQNLDTNSTTFRIGEVYEYGIWKCTHGSSAVGFTEVKAKPKDENTTENLWTLISITIISILCVIIMCGFQLNRMKDLGGKKFRWLWNMMVNAVSRCNRTHLESADEEIQYIPVPQIPTHHSDFDGSLGLPLSKGGSNDNDKTKPKLQEDHGRRQKEDKSNNSVLSDLGSIHKLTTSNMTTTFLNLRTRAEPRHNGNVNTISAWYTVKDSGNWFELYHEVKDIPVRIDENKFRQEKSNIIYDGSKKIELYSHCYKVDEATALVVEYRKIQENNQIYGNFFDRAWST